jgi:acyl-coenzyme A synthetase/AMP-(fatty) acid ligase
VSTGKPSTEIRVDARGTVSVGRPFSGVTVEILDDADNVLPHGHAGHITVTSTAATRGYFENAPATRALLFGPHTIRTGDVGYLDSEGFLYVLSRTKDVIIHAGASIYPDEVEEIVNAVGGVRYSAAIGIDHGRIEGEQVTVLAEIRPDALPDEPSRKVCVIAIARGIHDRFGFRPARVHLVAPRTIPLTHNGKMRRTELKRRYIDGVLAEAFLYPLRSAR